MKRPEVEADEAAAKFIVEHGGRFYVWVSSAGVEHEAVAPPDSAIDFVEYPAGDFTLFVDPGIEAASKWRLIYHGFPRPHVRALWNGASFSPSGPRIPAWEGQKPWGRN